MQKSSLLGHLSMLGANSAWGLLSPIAKIVMLGGVITPLVLTELRIAGAMLLFWAASCCVPREHVPHQDLLRFFFASLFAIMFNQGAFLFGVGLTSPADASILTTSMPLWAMILAALLLKEPVTAKKIIGIALGAGGALLLIVSSQQVQQTTIVKSGVWGDILVTCAQLSFAFYVVRFKDLIARYSLFTSMKWMFTFAFICSMPFSAISLSKVPWGTLTTETGLAILYVVAVATFGAYVLIAIGQRHLRPTVVAMYNYVQPVVASLVAAYLGLDRFTPLKLMAVVMIFAGVYLVTHSRTRREIEAYHQAQQAAADSAEQDNKKAAER